MARCEDYPCCGHGPPPLGDDGGCPNEDGSWNCCQCGTGLPKNNPSSLCDGCLDAISSHDPDCPGCPGCMDME